MYIPLKTLQQAARLVDSLADLDPSAEPNQIVLPGLAGLIGCDVVTYNEIGPAEHQVRYADYPAGFLNQASLTAFAAHVHEHPLISYHLATGDGGPVKISDFLSRREFHRLGLYCDFYRPIPVEHQLAFALPAAPGQVIGFALNRSGKDFTETDREVLAAVLGPLERALRRIRQGQRAQLTLTSADSGMLARLTDRELQVLQLAARGRTNLAIARAIDVSPRTIAKHLEHIYRKLGVTSRAAAVYESAAARAQSAAR